MSNASLNSPKFARSRRLTHYPSCSTAHCMSRQVGRQSMQGTIMPGNDDKLQRYWQLTDAFVETVAHPNNFWLSRDLQSLQTFVGSSAASNFTAWLAYFKSQANAQSKSFYDLGPHPNGIIHYQSSKQEVGGFALIGNQLINVSKPRGMLE